MAKNNKININTLSAKTVLNIYELSFKNTPISPFNNYIPDPHLLRSHLKLITSSIIIFYLKLTFEKACYNYFYYGSLLDILGKNFFIISYYFLKSVPFSNNSEVSSQTILQNFYYLH